MFEALQIIKSAYHNRVLNTNDEAAAHVAAEWDLGGLVDVGDSVEPI